MIVEALSEKFSNCSPIAWVIFCRSEGSLDQAIALTEILESVGDQRIEAIIEFPGGDPIRVVTSPFDNKAIKIEEAEQYPRLDMELRWRKTRAEWPDPIKESGPFELTQTIPNVDMIEWHFRLEGDDANG